MKNANAVVNYTEEMTAKVVADYQAGVAVEAIAESVGKTVRSVVAKLSREGVYKAKAAPAGKARELKANLAAKVVEAANLPADTAEELQKLTKQTLVNLLAAVER